MAPTSTLDSPRHEPTPIPGASRPTKGEQDMLLRLSTPQLNTLRYMVGQDIARYVAADRCNDYDGPNPLLVLHPAVPIERAWELAEDTGLAVKAGEIGRAADWDELSQLNDLKVQLDNLWHGHTYGA